MDCRILAERGRCIGLTAGSEASFAVCSRRNDVAIQMEQVVRIILAFQCCESAVILAVRRSNGREIVAAQVIGKRELG